MTRIFRRRRPLSDFAAGLIAVILVTVGVLIAFTQLNPFSNPYELSAVVRDAQNLKPGSPVRIAGVDVGQVTSVEAIDEDSGAAKVNMEIQDAGLPIRTDAQLQVNPRLFLEGNYVVDLKPGSPSAPALASGATIPISQTAHSVSVDQILRVLDKDSRRNLQTLLDEYSAAFLDGGAEAFRESIPFWREAYRTTALASDALLGTEEGDLQRVLSGQQRTFAALARHPEALKDLVTNLNVTTAAFAREDDALRAAVPELRDVLRVGLPALDSVNAALPPVRAFASEALPGVRSSEPTLRVARPFVAQLRGLVGEDELQGTAAELRRAIPSLARFNDAAVGLLDENRALASCTSNVLVPFAETPIPDPDFPDSNNEPFFQEAQRAFVGLAGESRVGDANGQWFRINAASSGANLVQLDGPSVGTLFGSPLFAPLGTRPAMPAQRPRFRPDVPCETQDPPNMAADLGQTATARSARANPAAPGVRTVQRELRKLQEFIAGERETNPLARFRTPEVTRR